MQIISVVFILRERGQNYVEKFVFDKDKDRELKKHRQRV